MVFTGEDTGVINAAEAAIATTIANGTGDTLSCVAREIAMGAIKIAVAVLMSKTMESPKVHDQKWYSYSILQS